MLIKTFFSPKQPELLHQLRARYYIKVQRIFEEEQKEKTLAIQQKVFLGMQEDLRTESI